MIGELIIDGDGDDELLEISGTLDKDRRLRIAGDISLLKGEAVDIIEHLKEVFEIDQLTEMRNGQERSRRICSGIL
jgi:hypothetical protein